MIHHHAMSRRQFTGLAASGLAGTFFARAVPAFALHPSVALSAWSGYETAIVIDNLATPGAFNVPNGFAHPFTPQMVANARASGITAVNVTLSARGLLGAQAFEATMRNIAFLENEFDRHPDVFVKVKTVADIRRAKEGHRIGLIPGFQDATMMEGDVSRVTTRSAGLRG